MTCVKPISGPSDCSTIRLPKLAAMTLVFLGLSANTPLDAAPAWSIDGITIPTHIVPQGKPLSDLPIPAVPAALTDRIHLLSPADTTLYRTIFAAQEKSDWKTADDALAQLKDKRLVGHALADRYARRGVTLEEARQWMSVYADLPEADALYEQASALHGFAKAKIAHPVTTASWSGSNELSSSSGFRLRGTKDGMTYKSPANANINAQLRGALSVSEANDATAQIAASFFTSGQPERARNLAHKAAAAGVPLGLWIEGLSAWKQKDYTTASQAFSHLAQITELSAWDRAAAAYWAYRAARRTGDTGQANRWLVEAAKYPHSFYGYMASSLMGRTADRSWPAPDMNNKNIATLAQYQIGWQALALVQVGKNDLAESELRRLNPTGHRDLQNAVLAVAENAHMPSLAVQLAGLATNDNGQTYEAAQYPLPPWQPANGFKVDRALIYALMKRESQFDPEAISQSGACGLMQIMPSTARQIANDNHAGKASANCPDRLFDPATNMEMGQKYVRVLAGQPMIGDNLLLLLAAYNGGPGNLARWMDGDNRSDPLLFIESLPARETHDYVQAVLLHYWMYRSRLAEPETTAAQLAHGEWPRYALRDDGMKRADAPQSLELASAAPLRMNGSR